MKKNAILIIIIFSFSTFHCQKQDYSVSQPSSDEAQKIQAIGDTLSTALLSKLKGALSDAIGEGGPVNAIQACNTQAIPLTEEIRQLSDHSVKIKRISSKYRNPRNAPDEIEQTALQHFEELSYQKSPLPDNYLQKVEKDGRTFFKYYKPLQIGGLCLNCHGDPQQMNPEVVGMIDELYPEDMAKGYQAGDFRGLISITLTSL